MSIVQSAKEKMFFWKDFWPTQFVVYRNRGDTFAPETVDAVRLKYSDKPNKHKLKTGEQIPAVPLDYVMTGQDGTAWIHAVEADDDQLVVWKPDFSLENGVEVPAGSDKINLDTDMEGSEIKDAFQDTEYDVVSFSVLENKDERKTFLAEEIKNSETKYKPSTLIRQYPQLTLVVTTAVAVTIILYATSQNYGQFIPVLKQFSSNMDVIQNLANTSPPGS